MNDVIETMQERLDQARRFVEATNKGAVLVVQQFPTPADRETLFPPVRESVANILAFVELGDPGVLASILSVADGAVDAIAVDGDVKLPQSRELIDLAQTRVERSRLFFYSDTDTWADAGTTFVLDRLGPIAGRKLLLTGTGQLADLLRQKFGLLGAELVEAEGAAGAEAVVGGAVKEPSLPQPAAGAVPAGIPWFDLGIGNFTREQVAQARAGGSDLYRLDNRAGVSSLAIRLLETHFLTDKIMGRARIKDVPIVAGGMLGEEGAVVVDDIYRPTVVFGIADGRGFLKPEPESEAERHALALVQGLVDA